MKIAPPALGELRPATELTERARRALLLRDSVEGLSFERDALEGVEGEPAGLFALPLHALPPGAGNG